MGARSIMGRRRRREYQPTMDLTAPQMELSRELAESARVARQREADIHRRITEPLIARVERGKDPDQRIGLYEGVGRQAIADTKQALEGSRAGIIRDAMRMGLQPHQIANLDRDIALKGALGEAQARTAAYTAGRLHDAELREEDEAEDFRRRAAIAGFGGELAEQARLGSGTALGGIAQAQQGLQAALAAQTELDVGRRRGIGAFIGDAARGIGGRVLGPALSKAGEKIAAKGV